MPPTSSPRPGAPSATRTRANRAATATSASRRRGACSRWRAASEDRGAGQGGEGAVAQAVEAARGVGRVAEDRRRLQPGAGGDVDHQHGDGGPHDPRQGRERVAAGADGHGHDGGVEGDQEGDAGEAQGGGEGQGPEEERGQREGGEGDHGQADQAGDRLAVDDHPPVTAPDHHDPGSLVAGAGVPGPDGGSAEGTGAGAGAGTGTGVGRAGLGRRSGGGRRPAGPGRTPAPGRRRSRRRR